jgi:hypothetical protein
MACIGVIEVMAKLVDRSLKNLEVMKYLCWNRNFENFLREEYVLRINTASGKRGCAMSSFVFT